jgi:hypothetical protein
MSPVDLTELSGFWDLENSLNDVLSLSIGSKTYYSMRLSLFHGVANIIFTSIVDHIKSSMSKAL